jgi:hypothetical protein
VRVRVTAVVEPVPVRRARPKPWSGFGHNCRF